MTNLQEPQSLVYCIILFVLNAQALPHVIKTQRSLFLNNVAFSFVNTEYYCCEELPEVPKIAQIWLCY